MSSTTPGSDPERPRDPDAVDGEPTRVLPTTDADGRGTDGTASDTGEYRPVVAPAPAVPVAATDHADEVRDAAPVAPADPAEASDPDRGARPFDATPEPDPVHESDADPADRADATARLDAAVERANAVPVASDTDETQRSDLPDPVPADSVRRETYVPAATVAAGTAAGAATLAPEPEPAYVPNSSAPQTVYVQAPTPPKTRGNRGFGVLVALIGAVIFALVYAGVAYLLLLAQGNAAEASTVLTQFLARPVFWVPVLAFFVGFALLAAIINRGAWWYYAVFGLLVGVLVYFSYIGGALLTVEAWTLTLDEAGEFIRQRWLDPFAIAAFIIAREIPIWLGGWLAARGRSVTERNRIAREAYDRELAAGPQPVRG